MARRVPVQQRSIDSMNRMINVGLDLFYEGGSPALTLEAVIERADTSTGSFYARFGDMRGYLDAIHEHVLQLVSGEVIPLLTKASVEPDLESAVQKSTTGMFEIIHRHRVPLYFFAVGNSHDREWRAMGTQFTLGIGDMFTQLLKSYLPKLTGASAKRRIDIAVRMCIAAVFQQMMLDQEELSRVNISRKVVAMELSEMVCSYLRATPAK